MPSKPKGMARISRAESLRAKQTREQTERPEGWMPPGAMPMDLTLGPDIKLRFIRRYINSAEEDKQALQRRMARGWVPVKPEEFPHLDEFVKDGRIEMYGCILCKNDARRVALDVQFFEDQAMGALNGAPGAFGGDHPDLFLDRNTRKSFIGKLPD